MEDGLTLIKRLGKISKFIVEKTVSFALLLSFLFRCCMINNTEYVQFWLRVKNTYQLCTS